MKLLVLGTGDFAEEIADMASDIPGVSVAGYVENMEPKHAEAKKQGLPVIWVDDLAEMTGEFSAVCGLGTTHRSRFVDQLAPFGLEFTTLVHPTARVSKTVTFGEGCVVNAGAIIAAHTTLGSHVMINRGATIGHHTRIGDYVTIGPAVNLSGSCRIGSRVYIGVGASIIDHISIGGGTVIAAGSVVTKDLPNHVLAAGMPARIVKKDIEAR
jgi:sugar O-acyltransferase (sialic acid O-acetyltransferase NeuD family)